jgi:hypothetical protein
MSQSSAANHQIGALPSELRACLRRADLKPFAAFNQINSRRRLATTAAAC